MLVIDSLAKVKKYKLNDKTESHLLKLNILIEIYINCG